MVALLLAPMATDERYVAVRVGLEHPATVLGFRELRVRKVYWATCLLGETAWVLLIRPV